MECLPSTEVVSGCPNHYYTYEMEKLLKIWPTSRFVQNYPTMFRITPVQNYPTPPYGVLHVTCLGKIYMPDNCEIGPEDPNDLYHHKSYRWRNVYRTTKHLVSHNNRSGVPCKTEHSDTTEM